MIFTVFPEYWMKQYQNSIKLSLLVGNFVVCFLGVIVVVVVIV